MLNLDTFKLNNLKQINLIMFKVKYVFALFIRAIIIYVMCILDMFKIVGDCNRAKWTY